MIIYGVDVWYDMIIYGMVYTYDIRIYTYDMCHGQTVGEVAHIITRLTLGGHPKARRRFPAGAMTLKEAFLVRFGEMAAAWCFWKRPGLAPFDAFSW